MIIKYLSPEQFLTVARLFQIYTLFELAEICQVQVHTMKRYLNGKGGYEKGMPLIATARLFEYIANKLYQADNSNSNAA